MSISSPARLGVGNLASGGRLKRVQGHPGVWEMIQGPDGRATFEDGEGVRPGEPHVIWRRIDTHSAFVGLEQSSTGDLRAPRLLAVVKRDPPAQQPCKAVRIDFGWLHQYGFPGVFFASS
jgi:hypothetical protein